MFSFSLETPVLPSDAKGWIAILALSIVCSGLGFILQTIAQKYTTPSRTGLIFSFCFSQSFTDDGKIYGNKVSIGGIIDSKKMYKLIVTDKRYRFDLFVQKAPQLEPFKPSFEDLYARIGIIEDLCSKLQHELEELKNSRLETESKQL